MNLTMSSTLDSLTSPPSSKKRSPFSSSFHNNQSLQSSQSSKDESLSSLERKRKKGISRSPFRILSPNQIHVNKSRRSSQWNSFHHRSSSLSPIHKEEITKQVHMDMSTTFTLAEEVEQNENSIKANDMDEMQRPPSEIGVSLDLENAENDDREDIDENEETKNKKESLQTIDSISKPSDNPLGLTLDLFVTSRRRRDVTFPSTEGEDIDTTVTTMGDADNTNSTNDHYPNMASILSQNEIMDLGSLSSAMDLDSENMEIQSHGSSGHINYNSLPASPVPPQILPPPPSFQYPKINIPESDLLKQFYNISISASEARNAPTLQPSQSPKRISHQVQLSWSSSGLLSLDEVILPALCQAEMNTLKKLQARAKRDLKNELVKSQANSSSHHAISAECSYLTHVEIIEECRKMLNKCTLAACTAARTSRLEREKDMIMQIKERRKQEKALKRRIYEEKKQAILQARAIKKEKKRRELKKNLPKNKENWREVAKLMTELAKLQKEKKSWKEAKTLLLETKEEIKKKENDMIKPLHFDVENEDTNHIPEDIGSEVKNVIQDITLATDRINNALCGVVDIMEKADQVTKGLYNKYKEEHQFVGYQGVNNPRGLMQALTMDL